MFILLSDCRDATDEEAQILSMEDAHRRYSAYLDEHKDRFPAGAYEFARAHQEPRDPRSLQDAWVESVLLVDRSMPAGGGKREVEIEMKLLGARRDGYLTLVYRKVRAYSLSRRSVRGGPTVVNRDEVRLSERGRVVHEIEFVARRNWVIECGEIEASWVAGPV